MDDDFQQIKYDVDGAIATVTLNRPEARNGYTVRMADELADAFDRADRDDGVRVACSPAPATTSRRRGPQSGGGLDPTAEDAGSPAGTSRPAAARCGSSR